MGRVGQRGRREKVKSETRLQSTKVLSKFQSSKMISTQVDLNFLHMSIQNPNGQMQINVPQDPSQEKLKN